MINSHVSPSYTSINSISNGLQRTIFQESQNLYNQVIKIIDYSSYIPYSECVLEHILTTSLLTNNEKLFYLIADSLSLINGKNTTEQRSATLSGIQWAKKLNCSKTEIFSLQKSLVKKGYFVIIKDTNEFGKTKRNTIIPTLPNQVFEQLYTAADKFNLDLKDKHLIPSATYFSTLTSVSKSPDSTDSSDSLYIQANKRTYLDKTKLFIKINYQILNLITASKQLSPFAKVLWLDFYNRCYKNHIKSKQFNDEQHSNDYFAFTASYQELETQFSCSKSILSKTIKSLEEGGYINRKRFHVKNDNENDNLHDKSLWTITVLLPIEHHQQIVELKARFNKVKGKDISISDPYISNSGHLLIKDFILNNNDIKNPDHIDANHNFFKNSKNLQPCSQSLSELSVSYNNFIQEKETLCLIPHQTETSDGDSLNNPGAKENKGSKDEVLAAITTEQHTDHTKTKDKTPVTSNNTTLDPNKNIKGKVELKIDNANLTKIIKFSPNASLKDWFPLSNEDVDMLNSKSGREFSANFINELLLKLHSKYPGRTFPTKNHMISYMSSALRRELHQAPMVNHETFKFARNNDEESIAERQRERYLSEVEYSINTNYHSQLRRKIAAMFEPNLAYQLLTTVKFTTTVQEQRSGNNYFDDQYLDTEPTAIMQEDDTLDNQQPGIIQNSQNHSFTVKLNQDISLSDLQRQILENSITSVYGHVDITYQQLQHNHKKTNKLQPRQQDETYLEELDPNSAWYKIRVSLKEQFGDSIDRAWFSKLTAEENLNTKTLALLASSNFIRDWINNKYGYVIKQFAQELGFQFVELVTKEQFLSHTA